MVGEGLGGGRSVGGLQVPVTSFLLKVCDGPGEVLPANSPEATAVCWL